MRCEQFFQANSEGLPDFELQGPRIPPNYFVSGLGSETVEPWRNVVLVREGVVRSLQHAILSEFGTTYSLFGVAIKFPARIETFI